MAQTHLTQDMLFLGLVVSVLAANSVIFFADPESRGAYSELIVIASVTAAAALAVALAARQIMHNRSHAKTYVCLAIGLVLWFYADIIWASYELVLHAAAPIPSLSDYLWLAGYPFFAYNLFATYHEFRGRFSKRMLVASIAGNAAFLAYLIPLTIGLSDLSTSDGAAMFAVLIAYPIMNAVLTVPALPILVGLWREKPWSIPWIFKSLSLFCIVVTDSWFAFIILSGLYEQVWLSSMLFGAEYLIMAGGLLWFNKFLIAYKEHSNGGSQAEHESPKAVFQSNSGRVRYLQVLVSAILIGGIVSYGFMASAATGTAELVLPAEGESPLMIGALLPLSGTLSSYGQEAKAALRIAVQDVNQHLAESGSVKRVGLVIEDTKTDPRIALERIKALDAQGIRIVLGPVTSAAVASVKPYADENRMLLVSIGSTAPDLSVPGDNLFRLIPDDTNQAKAVAKQMWDDGIRVVVPMWRTDIFGNNLHRLVEENFQELGGQVTDGVGYDPPVGDFSSSLHRINFIVWEQDLRSLETEVDKAVEQHGADHVGVYAVAFDEIAPIMIQAGRHPDLSDVRWYGSDGSAQNSGVVKNDAAAKFAVRSNFLNPIYGVEETEEFNKIEERIADDVGRVPRSYAEVTYDALWVAATTLDNYDGQDADLLRSTFLQTANSYVGVTGSTELNDAGDRKSGSYDFWAVRQSDQGFKWKNVGTILP